MEFRLANRSFSSSTSRTVIACGLRGASSPTVGRRYPAAGSAERRTGGAPPAHGHGASRKAEARAVERRRDRVRVTGAARLEQELHLDDPQRKVERAAPVRGLQDVDVVV